MFKPTWRFRPPPENARILEMCKNPQNCLFGNTCPRAHSIEELQEWRIRISYQMHDQKKIMMVSKQQLQSQVEYIRNSISESRRHGLPVRNMLAEVSGGRSILCKQNLFITHLEKNKEISWEFTVKTNFKRHYGPIQGLQNVFFLENDCREFSFSSLTLTDNSLDEPLNIQGDKIVLPNYRRAPVWSAKISLKFSSPSYGHFNATVIFDFGIAPRIVRYLGVVVAPEKHLFEKLSSASTAPSDQKHDELSWMQKYKVVSYDESSTDEVTSLGAGEYSLPANLQYGVEFGAFEHMDVHLTRENYRDRLHHLLFVEEYERRKLMSRLNVHCPDVFTLFRKRSNLRSLRAVDNKKALFVPISEETLEEIGILVSRGSKALIRLRQFVYGATNDSEDYVLHEALVTNILSGQIVLEISSKTLILLKSMTPPVPVDICFRFVNTFLCMHSAIDRVDLDLIFFKNFMERDIPQLRHSVLSPNQTDAVSRIIYSSPGLPVLLLGPFGTGKTQTVAEAVKILISQKNASRRCRILICTHSNSAADHYIEDYLHPMFKDNDSSCETPLRLYWEHRLATSISDTMLPYCIMDMNTGTFRTPSLEELERKTIVVTTLVTADMLIKCGVKPGFFTHIFIDEAAQAMELETLIPISLATEETKVVLAGDHLQLSPPVFSAIGRKLLLDKSLLVRLYEAYPANSPRKILLLENFRSYPEIVNIPSKLFYEGSLVSKKQLPGDLQYPVKFYGVYGLEEKAKDSPSYVNMAEVAEITERIEEMVSTWPKEHFGELRWEKTCVLCAHYAQIRQIRRELRLNGFSDVRVENVNNVQGLEFDVLFLSIVRTSRMLGPGQHEGKDLGFLSNPKLLNTAITRAKFCLVVIGDPKALCSIGDCRVCWKTILSQCSENGTFHYRVPLNEVLNSIREEQTPTVPSAINKSLQQSYLQPYVAPPVANHFTPLPWTVRPPLPDASMALHLNHPAYIPSTIPFIHPYSLPQTNFRSPVLLPGVSNNPVILANERRVHAGSPASPNDQSEVLFSTSPYRKIIGSEIDDSVRNVQVQSQDKFPSLLSESINSLVHKFKESILPSCGNAKHPHDSDHDSVRSEYSLNELSSSNNEVVEKPTALPHPGEAFSIEGSSTEHEVARKECSDSDDNSEESHKLCVPGSQNVYPEETSEEAALVSLCQTIRQNIANCLRNITETEEAVNMSVENPLEDELVKIRENLAAQLSLLQEQKCSLQQQQVLNRILTKSVHSLQEKCNSENFSPVKDRVEICNYSLSSSSPSRMTHIQKINLDSDNEVQEWYRLRRQDPIVQDYIKSFEMLSERARTRDNSQNQMSECCEISGSDNTDLASTLRGWVLQPQSVVYPCGSSWYEEHLSAEEVAEKLDSGEVVPCTLSVDKSSSGKSATCVVDDPSEKNIHIPDRRNMNRAFNTDYVAVEITQDLEDQDLREGKVVAILQERHHRQVVCRLASPESTLMIPINNVNPKFSILQSDNHVGQTGVAVFDTKGDQIQFQHFVSNVQDKLFLVQFLKWDVSYRYPLGFVAKCFDEYSDLRCLLPVLCFDFGIPNEFPVGVTEDVEERFPESWQVPGVERQSRTRYEDAFTIDAKEAEELDDAISIRLMKYGVYVITIHVADVSYFVKKDSLVDKIAQARATSVYLPPPSSLSVTLLPGRLGQICSLKPGKERLAVSVEFVIDLQGNILRSPTFCRSIVVSQRQFNFEEVDKFLTGKEFATTIEGASTPLLCSLQVLYFLSRELWARRVRTGSFQACADASLQSPSRRIVEELMIITNMAVADKLSNFPDSHVVPFRIQQLPKYNALQKLASWAAENELNLNEMWFTQWLNGFQEVGSLNSTAVCVDLKLWQNICQAVKSGIVADLTEGILSVHEKVPMTALIPRLQRLLPKSKYVTSNQYSSTERRHFALNADCYTHFTSPIRRYFDIVVHRVLFSETTAPIYDDQEMEVLCSMLNFRCGNAASLSKQCAVVCEAESLQETDGWKTMQVESLEAEYMTLKNSESQKTSSFQKVKWHDMGASLCHNDMPKFVGCWTFHDVNLNQGDSERNLMVNRLQASPGRTGFNPQGPTPRAQLSAPNNKLQRSVVPMSQHGTSSPTPDIETKPVLEIPVEMWCKLLQAAKEDITVMVKCMEIINKHAVFATKNQPSSENDNFSTRTDSSGCNILKRSFQCGNTLKALFTCASVSGLPQPLLQAVQVVPDRICCIQHHRQPVECFCGKAKLPTRERYSSVEEYQSINISLLKMESAERSVYAGLSSVLVRNVLLKWTKDASNVIRDHFYIHGNKLLPSINIHKDDFVCVHRCSSFSDGSSKTSTIVHGHIEDVVILNGNDRYVQLVLNSACTTDLPGEGIFTVEIIPQSLNYRRMITAVRNLPHATEEVRSLFLMRVLPSPVQQGRLKKPFPSSFTLDPSQKTALEKAIHSSVTIIEGLPGTGKTYIAAAIAEQFYLENSFQKSMTTGNVLYCCPTDQALNDAENILSRVSGIRLLRVYNREIEAESFPELATVYSVHPSISNSGIHTISEELALHFKIRSKSNPFHKKIQKYAQQLNMLKESVRGSNKGDHQQLDRVVEEYKKLVDMAEEFEFTEHGVNIVLCTCIEAGSLRMNNHARIKECIMDESHFCLEAESLVVFQTLGERCDRVVLLGDSRPESVPVIENKLARTFGLNRSLFSSLKNGRGKKRLPKLVLETQHRILGL